MPAMIVNSHRGAGRVTGVAPSYGYLLMSASIAPPSGPPLVRQAQCVRAIADVDKRAAGIYLFNFWAAADTRAALEVWEHLAPWFQSKTGLQNSTVLQPFADGDFAFVNHARWDTGLASIAAHQFLRPSFYTFVRRNLAANHIHVYPALYRKA